MPPIPAPPDRHAEQAHDRSNPIAAAVTDWLVLCVCRLDPADPARVTHVGVDVPRGTQHVPVAEAIAAIRAGRHRFFVSADGDLLQLRISGDGAALGTSLDAPGQPVLAR